jgi:hypothetical protein
MKGSGWGVATGVLGVAGGGMKLGSALGSTAVGLGAAAGAMGILGGSVMVAQGAWRIYTAGRRLSDLAAVKPASGKGRTWQAHARGREYRKAGVNALKIAAGALGIAAGALLIASNPVGWAIGLAGIAVGGALALGKLGSKISDAWNRRSAKKQLEKKGAFDALARPAPQAQHTPRGAGAAAPEAAQLAAGADAATGTATATRGAGSGPAAAVAADPTRRAEVHKLSDKVVQENSQNARYAAEMIEALRQGNQQHLDWLVEFRDQVFPEDADLSRSRQYLRGRVQVGEPELERYDSALILGALNVDPDTALSESGQDLIQKKLSVAEAV